MIPIKQFFIAAAQLADGWPRAWLGLLLSSAGLRKSERALHEYMGLAVLAAGIN